MPDHLIRCLLKDRPVRVVAAITTDTSRELSRRHGVVAGAQVALSRGATASLLVATMTKSKHERITLQVLGDGPLGGVVVDARSTGEVRAHLKHPGVFVPATHEQRTRLVGGMGRRGVVNVIRDMGLKERVSGQVAILSGEIDADVEHFLTTSEQIESALGSDAALAEDGSIRAAGGVLVQCLPDDTDNREMVAQMWRRLRLDAVYEQLSENAEAGAGAEDLARAVLGEYADTLEVLDIGPVRFHCPCSLQRVVGAIQLMSDSEIRDMIEQDGGAEVKCDFCGEQYRFDASQLAATQAARELHAKT